MKGRETEMWMCLGIDCASGRVYIVPSFMKVPFSTLIFLSYSAAFILHSWDLNSPIFLVVMDSLTMYVVLSWLSQGQLLETVTQISKCEMQSKQGWWMERASAPQMPSSGLLLLGIHTPAALWLRALSFRIKIRRCSCEMARWVKVIHL